VIAAINQAIALKDTYNIRVLNISLGRPVFESYTTDPLCQAVEAAWQAGIVVVVAAGNDGRDNSFGSGGYGTINSPANDPYVITVGAMKSEGTPDRSDDLVASYSAKGPTQVDHVVKPDLVAPGNMVVSLLSSSNATFAAANPQNVVSPSYYKTSPTKFDRARYMQLSGTSMATPVVSGAAALLIQQNPALTPDQIKSVLMATAYKTFPQTSTATDTTTGETFTAYYDPFTVGAGYLDIAAALGNTSVPTGSALSPIADLDPTTGEITVITDASSVWNSQAIWNTQGLWNTQAIWNTGVEKIGEK
jgi:serine protease AprX